MRWKGFYTAIPQALDNLGGSLDESDTLGRPAGFIRNQRFQISPQGTHYATPASPGELSYLKVCEVRDVTQDDVCVQEDVLIFKTFFVWHPSGNGVYYVKTRKSDPNTSHSAWVQEGVFYHRFGTPQSSDTPVPVDTQPGANPEYMLALSEDNSTLIVLNVFRKSGTMTYTFWDASAPKTPLAKLILAKGAKAFFIGDLQDQFYFLSKNPTGEKTLWRFPLPKNSLNPLVEIIDIGDFLWVSLVRSGLAVFHTLDTGSSQEFGVKEAKGVRVVDPNTLKNLGSMAFPNEFVITDAYSNQKSDEILIALESYTQAAEIRRIKPIIGSSEFLFGEKSRRWDPTIVGLGCVRGHIPGSDGKPIPVEICGKEVMESPTSPRPLLLEVYGAHGITLTPHLSKLAVPWMEAGGLFAVAHVRGSGGVSDSWVNAGRGPQGKKMAIEDVTGAIKKSYFHFFIDWC